MDRHHKYITLKVFRAGYADAADEVSAFLHLEWVKRSSTHPGSLLTRSTLKTFKIRGATNRHQCLVHEPLGITLTKLLKSCPSGKFPKAWLRLVLQQILLALDFIHSEAHVIHTGEQQ
jgi:serine/threonine-protein kinase SRPK3